MRNSEKPSASEHSDLDRTFGSETSSLRIALAEAEMEISLLKIELQRNRERLDRVEAALQLSMKGEAEPATASPESELPGGTPSAPPSSRGRRESGFVAVQAPNRSIEAAIRAAAER